MHANVAWTTLTKEKREGGVVLIDLVVQTKALLGKLVVKSLPQPKAPWKILWRQHMEDVVAETRWKLAKQSFWGTCAKNAFTQMWGMYVEYMCFWNYEGVARN